MHKSLVPWKWIDNFDIVRADRENAIVFNTGHKLRLSPSTKPATHCHIASRRRNVLAVGEVC